MADIAKTNMIGFGMEILDARDIARYVESAPTDNEPYMLRAKFPEEKRNTNEIDWIVQNSQRGIMVKNNTIDTKPELRSRQAFNIRRSELPFFREGIMKNELDLMKIYHNADPRRADTARAAIRQIYNDVGELVMSSQINPEYMRARVFQGFQIVLQNGGNLYEFDYDPDNTWKQQHFFNITGDGNWNDEENSVPLDDIQFVLDAARDLGKPITEIWMNRTTWQKLQRSAQIRDQFPVVNQRYVVSPSEEQAMLSRLFPNVQFIVYDKTYIDADEENTVRQFIEDDMVVFCDSGVLGNTVFGSTPEEASLQLSNQDTGTMTQVKDIAQYGVGTFISIVPHAGPPAEVGTFVSFTCAPTFERQNNVFSMRVAQPEDGEYSDPTTSPDTGNTVIIEREIPVTPEPDPDPDQQP